MAKSKADYYAEGKADHDNGVARRTGFTKNSWQENAYDAGFNDALRVQAEKQAAVQIMSAAEAARTARDDGGCLTFETVQAMATAPADQRIAPTTFVKPAPVVKIDNPPRVMRTGNPTFDARYSHVACLRADADKETNPVRAARLRAKANAITSRIWAIGTEA